MELTEIGRVSRHGEALPALVLPAAPRGSRKITTRSRFSARGYVVASLPADPKCAQRIGYESNLERSFVLLALAGQDVVDIVEQPFTLTYRDNLGRARRYTFDYLITQSDGQKYAVEVKTAARATQKNVAAQLAEVAARLPRDLADYVLLFTDADFQPWMVGNAAQLLQCRQQQDPEADECLLAVVAELRGQIAIRDLVIRVDMGSRGYKAIIRALYAGTLRAMTNGLHGPDTLIMREALQ